MFFHGEHKELIDSIEAIGAGFAVYEYDAILNIFNLVSCNTLFEELIGKEKNNSLNQDLNVIFPRYISQPLSEAFVKCKIEQNAIESEILVEYKGEERYWRSIISPILEKKDGRLRIIQTCVEITEKKQLEKKLNITMKRYEAVVKSAYDGIITIDESQIIKLINDAAMHIFGYPSDEIIGESLTKLLPQKYRKNHVGYVEGFKNSKVDSRPMQTRASVRGLRKDGTEFPIEVTISKIHVEEKIELTAVIRDISEKNKLLEELLIASREDPLTKLLNRRHFTELFSSEIQRHKRFKRPFSLIMIDIDHFKNINDTYGHECGDQALLKVTQIFKTNLRDIDIVSRWGGEEFLIILPETELQAAKQVADKIRTVALNCSFNYLNDEIKFTLSLGVLQYLENESIDSMINTVDGLLYKAKKNGRNLTVWE